MEQDIIYSKSKSQNELPQLQGLVSDARVQQLLRARVQLIPSQIFTLQQAYNHLFIIINLNHYKRHKEQKGISLNTLKTTDIASIYALKISKRFPLKESVRLLMLDGGFQPKISDTRDLMEDVLARTYHYSITFVEILDALILFDYGLHHKNEMFLQMQKIGKFSLGERYIYDELAEYYSSLILLKDNTKKSNTYIGVSQTHILIFKEIETSNQKESLSKLRHPKTIAVSSEKQVAQRDTQEQTLNPLVLIASAELQCIESIFYKQSQKLVRVVYRKYKSIKLYHEFEEIRRQYKLKHPQVLLRALLKHITKFQQCFIQFEPYRQVAKKDKKPTITESMVTHRQNERINYYYDESGRLQQVLLRKESTEEQRKKAMQNLNRFYQKLIEYFSTRASPYYLIYVNKLNLLYTKYYQNPDSKA